VAGKFQKISRISSLTGGTKWYLNDDCLLAAKRITYVVEYRRFYLTDIESIVVWPNPLWIWRPIIPAGLFFALGALLWFTVNHTAGLFCFAFGCGWAGIELLLGSTAKTRIQTTGTSVDLPIVARTRRAHRVLAKINAAMQAARGETVPQAAAPAVGEPAAAPVVADAGNAGVTTQLGDAT